MKNKAKGIGITALIAAVVVIGFSFTACGGGGGGGGVTIPGEYHGTWYSKSVVYFDEFGQQSGPCTVKVSDSLVEWKIGDSNDWDSRGPFVKGRDGNYDTTFEEPIDFVHIHYSDYGQYRLKIDIGYLDGVGHTIMSGTDFSDRLYNNDPGELDGTWTATIEGGTATVKMDTYGFTINYAAPIGFTFSGDFDRTGDSAGLYSPKSGYIGTAELTAPNTLKLSLNENSGVEGTYTLTKE